MEDLQVEGDHSFDVNISPADLATRRVTVGTPGTTTVIIDDDDGTFHHLVTCTGTNHFVVFHYRSHHHTVSGPYSGRD